MNLPNRSSFGLQLVRQVELVKQTQQLSKVPSTSIHFPDRLQYVLLNQHILNCIAFIEKKANTI